ncbi:MAG: glycosyltransferase family 2 protein [Rikenellaceae bacterium]
MESFTVGVIISTYNSPAWLEKCLWGYLSQEHKADEIIIADDGSRPDTREMIERYALELPITHVWHEDDGFQKSKILNRAVEASTAQYLIFTDQDCIPRKDFVETHVRHAQKGYLLSGGYFRLPMSISQEVVREDVTSGNAFQYKWLKGRGLKWDFKCTKLCSCRCFTHMMNAITPAKATWNGCNASGWREDVVAANGFNEQMQYGGQDREFGERLFNRGIRSKQLRYSAIALHLDHKRPYKTKESIDKNLEIRRQTRRSGITSTPYGIKK